MSLYNHAQHKVIFSTVSSLCAWLIRHDAHERLVAAPVGHPGTNKQDPPGISLITYPTPALNPHNVHVNTFVFLQIDFPNLQELPIHPVWSVCSYAKFEGLPAKRSPRRRMRYRPKCPHSLVPVLFAPLSPRLARILFGFFFPSKNRGRPPPRGTICSEIFG